MIQGLGDMNLSLTFAAMGSAFGTGVAGMAAIGAMKKCFSQKKNPPFQLILFSGFPLSQTLYGMVLRNALKNAPIVSDWSNYSALALMGLVAGIAMGTSAYMQGKAAARACDALAETGEGVGKYIAILGIIESVALLVMVFCLMAIPKA
ncbi:MAG: V-type ATP synthase subunit K [Candidatus Omnitrophica bacterium]|nr:V-type ATP synthase subunit K [Candidatus Omnitrophota bacterium]